MVLPFVALLLATAASPPPPVCPWPAVAAAVSASGGRLSVGLYNQTQHAGAGDDGAAIRWAVNASHFCGGVVFFPQGEYVVNRTVELPSDTTLLGGGGRSADQFQTGPQGAVIRSVGAGPVFLVHNTGVHENVSRILYTGMKIRFENLVVVGRDVAVVVSGGALIRIINCALHASANGVNTTAAGCDGCNAVLGGPHMNSTALLVINTYWMWVEDSSFFSNLGTPAANFGQRPSVILRGDSPVAPGGVTACYLLYFTRCIFSGGAVQYQQLTPANQWPGFFQFLYCQTETSGTPLLDIQVKHGLSAGPQFQSVIVSGYRPDDTVAPNYLGHGKYPDLVAPGTRAEKNAGLVPVIALNCSAVPGCHLDGVSITSGSEYGGASAKPSPAIRVFSGSVSSVTILSSQLTGSVDVLDAHNVPQGSWISRSAGGFTFVCGAKTPAGQAYGHVAGEATLTAGGRGAEADTGQHAALVGLSGERYARYAIDSDGSQHWGDGQNDTWHTSMLSARSATCAAKALTIEPHGVAKACVLVLWTNSGSPTAGNTMNICEATHEGLDETNLELEVLHKDPCCAFRNSLRGFSFVKSFRQVSCRILSIKTGVVVAVRNHGASFASLAAGKVIVVLRRYVS